jgi:hypothetical protein
LESEVFLLGKWKNFDELESSLSLEELTALVEFSRKKDYDNKKFMAAINGVDLDEEDDSENDIIDNRGSIAEKEGFGIGEGLGHMQLEG